MFFPFYKPVPSHSAESLKQLLVSPDDFTSQTVIWDEGAESDLPINTLTEEYETQFIADEGSLRGFTFITDDCDISIGKGELMRSKLRLFVGDDDTSSESSMRDEVSMDFDTFCGTVSHAILRDSSWLSDFGDERIRMSADLYEILTAYAQLRPSA
ncbi:MAG: hypothetical protein KDA81_04195 [Planctomycetaceae bacterium]|nr:hypothetical protein [Planctomycetaceae bacterium]